MPGKARPSLRSKTLSNVDRSNLSITDKKCIAEIFERFSQMEKDIKEYQKYLITCLFSHRDYFTEEKILSFEEFRERG